MVKESDVWVKRVGVHRGAPRVFLDAAQAARAGFRPGEPYEVRLADGGRVCIEACPDGSRVVSKRERNGKSLPVLDINSKELLAAFEGMDRIRVVVQKGRVVLLPLATEVKKRERLERLMHKLGQGEPLAMGSLSHGGGVLSRAIQEGLEAAGIQTSKALVNEIREDLLLNAMEHDRLDGAMVVAAPMQEAAQDDWLMERMPKLEILEMGLPCSGASKAGVAKRHLTHMEDHPEVGHLVVAALMILSRTQPAVVLLENVVDYKGSASASILRHQLRDMGYQCHEAILSGKDYGAMENRVRWCLVATTHGLDFDFESLRPQVHVVRRLGELLDPDIGPDSDRWRSFAGIKDKAERDRDAGKGFKMQVIHPDDTSVPTLRKGYYKGGTTDPLLEHPDQDGRLRLLTAAEHARIKGVPEELIDGLSESIAHQLLGQGIVYAPFSALGRHLGEALQRLAAAEGEGGPTDVSDLPDEPDGRASARPRALRSYGVG